MFELVVDNGCITMNQNGVLSLLGVLGLAHRVKGKTDFVG